MKKNYVRPVIEVNRVVLEEVVATSFTATPQDPMDVNDFEYGGTIDNDNDILLF